MQHMFMAVLLIPIGFVLLIKGADALVDGSCSVAKRYGISDLIIGLTVVAFGTSAPELVVCIIAAVKNNGGISIGNIIGSNIANICLILGIAGIILPLAIQKVSIKRDLPFLLLTTFVLLGIVTTNNIPYLVSRMEASVLLALMAAYMYFMLRTSCKGIEDEMEKVEANKTLPAASMYIVGGLAGLMIGGEIVVRNSVTIALHMGVSEAMIGLTIVALGTSLPELATSIVAVRKNKTDIAVGNVIGSNIFNTCLVLGFTAMIRPVTTSRSFIYDMLILSAASVLFIIFMFTGKKKKIDRWEAAIFVVMYVAYVVYTVYRG